MMIETITINNKKVYAFSTKNQLLEFICDNPKILIALNAEKLNKNNEKLNQIISNNIGYPDGIGAVLALKRKGLKSIKIAGAEFWLDILEKFQDEKSFYFIGSTDEVINRTVSKLKGQFSKLNIKGFRNGFLNEKDKETLLNEFIELKPDVIFVAQGTPKQEFLMDFFSKEYPALYMGLGGSFDVYCGLKKRAPKIFINCGLEWLYRLIKEPTRLKRQIILVNFAFKILTNRI